jgi:dTDP-4-dehydrorhamnose reductase
MNILIYGHKGWIGQLFIKILKEIKPTWTITLGQSRVDNTQDVVMELMTTNPDRVFCCTGRTYGPGFSTIDYLEPRTTGEAIPKMRENIRDNLFAPVSLALLCKKFGIFFCYLGTGCIFKFDPEHLMGDESTGFSESDNPNFFGSSYSVVKGFTDQLMRLMEDNTLNLRIRMPISRDDSKRNFITKIITYQKICSIPNSMTVLEDLLPLAIDMIENKITGTVNLSNPGLISHNEILELYRDIVDPHFTWENFDIEEQRKILLADRSNNCLSTELLQTLYPQVKTIQDAVIDTLKYMTKSRNSTI